MLLMNLIALVCHSTGWFVSYNQTHNGYRIYVDIITDRGNLSKIRIGQFVHPVGGKGME